LAGPSINGTLPDELSVLTEMRHFALQGYAITGSIPSSIGTSWTNLNALLVNDNRLEGTFPFMNSPLLGTIFLNDNKIADNVDALFSHSNLKWLEANNNKFTGTLPHSITELPYLSKICSL
jgi:hypothetical protein